MSKQQSQEYRGNGNHGWELVSDDTSDVAFDLTIRLRVPGGWIYKNHMATDGAVKGSEINMVFVPMPEVVKHEV